MRKTEVTEVKIELAETKEDVEEEVVSVRAKYLPCGLTGGAGVNFAGSDALENRAGIKGA